MFKFKSGDEVVVMVGKDKGKVGSIKKILVSEQKVIVNGVNFVQKRLKTAAKSVLKIESPIDRSNIMHLDSVARLPTKIGFKFVDGKKVRYYKKSGRVFA